MYDLWGLARLRNDLPWSRSYDDGRRRLLGRLIGGGRYNGDCRLGGRRHGVRMHCIFLRLLLCQNCLQHIAGFGDV